MAHAEAAGLTRELLVIAHGRRRLEHTLRAPRTLVPEPAVSTTLAIGEWIPYRTTDTKTGSPPSALRRPLRCGKGGSRVHLSARFIARGDTHHVLHRLLQTETQTQRHRHRDTETQPERNQSTETEELEREGRVKERREERADCQTERERSGGRASDLSE
eukprot:992016-Rhodomonas_salina.1